MPASLTLHVLPGEYAVCRLPGDAALPAWAHLNITGPAAPRFVSVTRAGSELSIVLPAEHVPDGAHGPHHEHVERGWRCLGIDGPLDFSLVGVVAGVSGALAGAGLSLFVVSTFDTDYILVRAAKLNEAISALAQAGYSVRSDPVTHFSHDAP
ncbi:MAG: ACT domain-containing protein [Anaerolineae bacterium]|nr:ACT domain-containing protein [Anaerolineae bacterium]